MVNSMETMAVPQPWYRQKEFRLAVGIALVAAVWWWLVAQLARERLSIVIWEDQMTVFMYIARHVSDPYGIVVLSPPWTAVILAPFGLLPLSLSVLAQLSLYFVLLAAVVYRFGGDLRAVLLALTSFVAFDSALELNVEWIVCIGLLTPPLLSGPFLLVKPHSALGYWLTIERRELVKAVGLSAALVLASFVLWGWWPGRLQWDKLYTGHNLAPIAFLPWPLSLAVAALLAWRAVRNRDAVYGVLAWLFVTPYIGLYGLLPHYALLACRRRRLAFIIGAAMWAIYGGVIAQYLLRGA